MAVIHLCSINCRPRLNIFKGRLSGLSNVIDPLLQYPVRYRYQISFTLGALIWNSKNSIAFWRNGHLAITADRWLGGLMCKLNLTGHNRYVWLVWANEQPELILNAKNVPAGGWWQPKAFGNHASGGKLYVSLLSTPLLLFTTWQATKCGRREAYKAIIFNWGRESHH